MRHNGKYKLLVTDIDGTLEGRGGHIAREEREALSELRRRGIGISLSTGRVASACQEIIRQLSLDGYHIFCDGALVTNSSGEKRVSIQPLNDEVVTETIDFAHSRGIYLELSTVDKYFVEQITEATTIHQGLMNLKPTVVDFTTIVGQESFIKENLIRVHPRDDAGIEEFWHHFEHLLHLSRVRIPRCSGIDFINVVAPDVSKGKALEVLTSHLGISIGEVMAVGDGMNDISLLSSAGLGIAMESAPDEVKAAADGTTLDVEHHGLAHAIKKFLL